MSSSSMTLFIFTHLLFKTLLMTSLSLPESVLFEVGNLIDRGSSFPLTLLHNILLYLLIYLLIVGRLGEKILLVSIAKNVLAVQLLVWCVNDCQGSSAETDLLTDSVHMCVCVCFEEGEARLCHSLNTLAYRLDKVFSSACAHRRVHLCRHADHLCGYAKETHGCVCLQLDRQAV